MLRDWTGDWIGTFMGTRHTAHPLSLSYHILGHKGAVWSSKLSSDTSRAVTGSADFTASVPLSSYKVHTLAHIEFFFFSKVWDTYTGEALHSFPHNHIVRSVDISPAATQIATGDQEKKIRIFDLNRPDADPRFLTPRGKDYAHEKTVRSVVWLPDSNTIVSGGEDGAVQ